MKKPIRLFASLVSLFALTACQDLGSEIPQAEAEKQQAKITASAADKAPNAYSITVKANVAVKANVSSLELTSQNNSMNYKMNVNAFASYNINKLYGFTSTSYNTSETVDSTNTKNFKKVEAWAYYKEGNLYAVARTNIDGKESKIYAKTPMSEAAAKENLKNYLVQSYYADRLQLSDIQSSLAAVTTAFNTYVTELKVDTSIKYYSKGDGSLSLVSKASASEKQANQGSLKYKLNFTATIENYMLVSASEKCTFSMKDAKTELVNANVGISINGAKSCSVSYPNLSNYTEGEVDMSIFTDLDF